MRETGIVIKLNGTKAVIRMTRGKKCEGCNVCNSFGDGYIEVEAENPVAAQEGDKVEVEINPKHVVGHAFLIFIFPLIATIIGYFIGASIQTDFVGSPENRGIIFGFLFLVFSFIFIKLYDYLFSQKNKQSATIVGFSQGNDENSVFW